MLLKLKVNQAANKFLYGQQLFWSLRVTVGVFIPGLVLYVGLHLPMQGMAAAIGAILIGVVDFPASLAVKCKEMVATAVAVMLCSAAISMSLSIPWLLWPAVLLVSALGAYLMNFGVKAGLIGLNCTISVALALSLRNKADGAIDPYLLGLGLGCLWYIVYSLVVCKIWHYQMHRRALADVLFAISGQLHARARCYDRTLSARARRDGLQRSQNQFLKDYQLARELIIGEVAALRGQKLHAQHYQLFNLSNDCFLLFDEIVSAHVDFERLKPLAELDGVLAPLRELLHYSAYALEQIAMAITLRRGVKHLERQRVHLHDLLRTLAAQAPLNPEAGAALQGCASRVRALHALMARLIRDLDSSSNTTGWDMDNALGYYRKPPAMFTRPSSWLSGPVFAHSLRLMLAVLLALVVGSFWQDGHNNWVVMTVVVAMRPNVGLSWQRGIKRIQGTVLGCVLAVLLLALISNIYLLLVLVFICLMLCLVVAMLDYIYSALFCSMTLLLTYHLLAPSASLLLARIIDTIIGVLIVIVISRLLPYWASGQIKGQCQSVLQALGVYLARLAELEANDAVPYYAKQREAFLSLMLLGNSYNIMQLEPERTRLGSRQVDDFINLGYALLAQGSHQAQSFMLAPSVEGRQAILAARNRLLAAAPTHQAAADPLQACAGQLAQTYSQIQAL